MCSSRARRAAAAGPPERLSSRIVGRYDVFDVERHELAREGGGTWTVHTMRMPSWVTVAAVTADGRFVLVRQHRHGVDREMLETPGGIVDPGEQPAAAALRELREETGYSGSVAEPLGWVHPNPALQDNRCYLFLARGVVEAGAPEVHDDERTEPVLLAPDAVKAAIDEGEIVHALPLVALCRAFSRLAGL